MDAHMATCSGGEAWDLYNIIIAINNSILIIFNDSASPKFIKLNLR